MARMRYLKPGYFLNDLLAEIEPLGRLLFAGLWCYADRNGKLEDRPKRLKAEILPYDNCNINKLLQELHNQCFIIRYTVNNDNYIKITNWDKHQSPNIKEQDSIIPEPDEHNLSIIQVSCKNSNGISLTDTDTDTDTDTERDSASLNCPHESIKELFRDILPELPQITTYTKSREDTVRARWKENPILDYFEKYFKQVKESDFLMGNNDKSWKAYFDWLMKPSNMSKVIEGNYINHKNKKPGWTT